MKKITSLGIGLLVGSSALSKVGGMAPAGSTIPGTAQQALGIASMGMPIMAAGKVMKATERLYPKKKKK